MQERRANRDPPVTTDAPAAAAPEMTIEGAIDHAKRAFALKKYEQAVEHYGTALELMTKKHGEDAPETADLYFSYGKALLENAIAQSTVLGKDGGDDALGKDDKDDSSANPGAILSFSGDVEDEAVDLFAEASKAAAAEEEDADEEEEDGAEPEDDFNAAWEVLDLARAIYEKQKDEDEEVRLKLADTYIALGDVSLETGMLPRPLYHADRPDTQDRHAPTMVTPDCRAHYKLSIVLDLTMGRLADAIVHAQKALESVDARVAELKAGLEGTLPPIDQVEAKADAKGKGKAAGGKLVRDDLVQKMSKAQIEAEIKELAGLKEDLALKVEEMKTSPNEGHSSAPALVAQALDKELNAGAPQVNTNGQLPVYDLTSVVKKKKKAPEEGSAEKRKAEDDGSNSPAEKKARLEGAAEASTS
ncbi:hypothetical protein EVG20_g11513 [Dentipellis fragilis]|uniref:Tetratricopeptide SHNi-TPR domain-containing protein n=1 Tax=Dentipellis fragilis TaxID=205917 RepID=A0A4Y9XKD8_9AGAM|nr:hypothetical protein EVG20_g11513 [Dentipellis fragilis]